MTQVTSAPVKFSTHPLIITSASSQSTLLLSHTHSQPTLLTSASAYSALPRLAAKARARHMEASLLDSRSLLMLLMHIRENSWSSASISDRAMYPTCLSPYAGADMSSRAWGSRGVGQVSHR